MGFVGNYAPYGLSPQIDGMPVIHEKDREGFTVLSVPDGYLFSFG
jgi:Iap family predicted aminopeptidase